MTTERPTPERLEELRSSNHPVVAELFAEIEARIQEFQIVAQDSLSAQSRLRNALDRIDHLTAERDHLADRVEALEAQQSDLMAERDRLQISEVFVLKDRDAWLQRAQRKAARVEALESAIEDALNLRPDQPGLRAALGGKP